MKWSLVAIAALASASIAADPKTGASTRPDPHSYATFDYTSGKSRLRLVVPEGLDTIRGLLVVAPFSGGDTRDFHKEVWYREFLHLHGFAFLGADWTGSHDERFKVYQAAIERFAKDAKRPELKNVPYAATGFSAGGGFASKLVSELPDRVIAAAIVGSRLNLPLVADAHRGVPILVLNGEHEDNGMAKAVAPLLERNRPKGALWGWMAIPGLGHERDSQEVVAMALLDAAVRLRYPTDADVRNGPVKLKSLDPASGWLADNTTWTSGLTRIAPARDFKGDLGQTSWLPNEDLAFAYRALVSYDRPLSIASPRNTADNARTQVWDAGGQASITVDDSKFAGWTTLSLYDGSKKVAELKSGKAEFVVQLKEGFHVFTALGTDAKGRVRTSEPILVTVRR